MNFRQFRKYFCLETGQIGRFCVLNALSHAISHVQITDSYAGTVVEASTFSVLRR
jgi:hypothetical protein